MFGLAAFFVLVAAGWWLIFAGYEEAGSIVAIILVGWIVWALKPLT